MIVKSNGYIFGGYTETAWKSDDSGVWNSDENSFLFSLVNKDNEPIKMSYHCFDNNESVKRTYYYNVYKCKKYY